MRTVRMVTILSLLLLAVARGDDQPPAPSPTPPQDGVKQTRLISINGQGTADHPQVINVLPGQPITFKADLMQFANACSKPEGCPEGRGPEEFLWNADDHPNDSCSPRRPDECRDLTNFQADSGDMIFHIPYVMGQEITIRVTHENGTQDSIVLHNEHLLPGNKALAAHDVETHLTPVYPRLEDRDPCWNPYFYGGPYYYHCGYTYWSPYAYHRVWWGGPYYGWTVGWRWSGYAGYYSPGVYGYYHGGWWRPGFGGYYGYRRPYFAPHYYAAHPYYNRGAGPVAIRSAAPRQQMAPRTNGYAPRGGGGRGGGRGRRRR